MNGKIKFGFVGVRRSTSFLKAVDCHPAAEVAALCDIQKERAEEAAGDYHAQVFTDYEQMLCDSGIQAVVIATPMQLHATQAVQALDRDIHVLSEVTAAVSLSECRELVAAAKRSSALYMMAENYCYTRPNAHIEALAKAGVFGELYFAEGEYLHEVKQLNEDTPWRRKWHSGINGCTYPTHSLGPILRWFDGQRVVSVSCVGSGHHYRDPRNVEYENEDTTIMLCRLSGGGLVKIRLDMLSERPHAMTNYTLQGTKGAYESARARGEPDRIWLKDISKDYTVWEHRVDYEKKFLPEFWKNPPREAIEAGHGGGDYFVVQDFIQSLRGEIQCPIDVHRALDMTLPGLISQESIKQGGVWLEVPNSRDWENILSQ